MRDYQEIVFFDRLGFGWVVESGTVAKVFPDSNKKRGAEEGIGARGIERIKGVRR